ncbi:MAG TPA: KpsF/GutQ family sugar-phosphate isomerase [Bacteroidota bacterium]|nr:KpsF/GutQ family sugar-phosphate isomerase [Bacteroidota bacterium]
MSATEDIEKGREVIRIEMRALAMLEGKINEAFASAVDIIYGCKGRIIVTGMGKSGLIGRKIVATMNSTGTPALFMHPSDAVHGDLGMVRADDAVLCISKSGDTKELMQLLPLFKRIGVPVISMVGILSSPLARGSDVVLDVSVAEEACPLDLAPTASTTATLALGDALAVTLLEKRHFTADDFALFHPGGNLGKRLLLKVEEFMAQGDNIPIVQLKTSLRETILVMTSKRLGATCVVDEQGILRGIITDGDLRRLLQKTAQVSDFVAEQIMIPNPKTIRPGMLAAHALQEMEAFKITQLVIVDGARKPVGMLHLHDLVNAGLSNDNAA